jgi:hypothetical protein
MEGLNKNAFCVEEESFLATSQGAKPKKICKNPKGKDKKTQRNRFDKKESHWPVQKSKRPVNSPNSKSAFFQIFHLGAKTWNYCRHHEGGIVLKISIASLQARCTPPWTCLQLSSVPSKAGFVGFSLQNFPEFHCRMD